MTKSHHDHPPSSGDQLSPDAERIAAELAALGEDPAEDEELSFVSTHADPDVRTVATLVELSTWTAPSEGLQPLERHRVWRRVLERAEPPSPVADPGQTAANGTRGLRGLVAGLALVASVALMPQLDTPPAPTEAQRAATLSVGEAARTVLDTLPGEDDGPRARSMADGYAERLQAARGASR